MHILVIHPDPRFYRELLPLLSLHEASSAFARTLSAACDQIEAQSPDVIVLCSPSLQEQERSEAFLALLGRMFERGYSFLPQPRANRSVPGRSETGWRPYSRA